MKDAMQGDVVTPETTPQAKVEKKQNPPIVLSQNPKKVSVVIDASGNLLSSKNPHEAVIIQKQNLND